MTTFEFEITIQSELAPEANRWPVVVRCKQPDGLPIHAKEILELGADDSIAQLTAFQENEKQYGILLGKALFKGEIYTTFLNALSKSDRDLRLRLLLSIEAAEGDKIRTLHWERLCAPIDGSSGWQLLARDQRVPFSRYIPTIIDRRFPPIGRRDLRALILVASPVNIGKYQLAPFDVEAAIDGVKTALGDIPYNILANGIADALGPPTLEELSKQLTEATQPYTLLHVISHGSLSKDGETALFWADADDRAILVRAEQLLERLKNIGGSKTLPHFAFLCTCESADPRAEGALGGLAQRLVRNLGMPAVVAMTRKVSIETGLVLGSNFYRCLRESGEVDVALQQATASLGERHDITVPALFTRLGGRPLFSDRLENRELTDLEIDEGIAKFEQLLKERAPNASVLKHSFQTQVEILKKTKGAESKTAREERHNALVELDNLCEQVLEIRFETLALGKEPPPYFAECPFPGLSSFAEEQYHKFFFGREGLIRNLKVQLERDNFLAVIGPSGSGKSSVVLAGLIPQLRQEEPTRAIVSIKPGKEALKQIRKLTTGLTPNSILVVDQFEEIFTLCENEEDRQAFIQILLKIAEKSKVIITIRADFLGECTLYPELRKRIEAQQKLVGPMEPNELISAMTMQANQAGLKFESGSSQDILDDVKEEPGAMPLLQYALQELWQRRRGRWLCGEEYIAIGRVQRAIAKTADEFYHRLPEGEQQQVQNIFLRLTRLDESTSAGETRRDTRRRVALEDLVATGNDLTATKKLVEQLAGEGVRLVVTSRNEATGKEEVEVAHEALIRHWQTLKDWLKQNRNDLQLRESLASAARDWQVHRDQGDRENYLIHKGGRLDDAEVLRQSPKLVQLNALETEYVKACAELRDRTIKQEKRRLKRQLAAVVIGVFVSAGFVILTGFQQRRSETQLTRAIFQSVETSLAIHQTLDAKVGSLQAARSYQQAISQKIWPDAELKERVWGKLLDTYYSGQEVNRLESDRDLGSATISPDSRVAICDDRGVRLWNPKNQQLEPLPNGDFLQNISSTGDKWVAFSPDGRVLAINQREQGGGGVYLWDTQTHQHNLLPNSDGSYEVMFSSDSNFLVSTRSTDGTIKLWNAKTRKISLENTEKKFCQKSQILALLNEEKSQIILSDAKGKKQTVKLLVNREDEQEEIADFIVSPDCQYLAVIGNEDSFWLGRTLGQSLTKLKVKATGVAFSPDSQFLVTGSEDGTLQLWDYRGSLLNKELAKQKSRIEGIALSPNDDLLATGTYDGSIQVWSNRGSPVAQLRNAPAGKLVKLFEVQTHQDSVPDIGFSQDGKQLISVEKNKEEQRVNIYQIERDLDKLIAMNCQKVRDYLNKTNNSDDRALCNGVPPIGHSTQNIDVLKLK
ncbi:CHAT domain-containing protein [Oscillatoria sp. FACHB-1406]|uniref:nSTAND1 domain-containing NTPase n=1 Tax=Oscillatoria sp. FACHB-1406 TaxID=2692846 RepID=UPI001685CEF0|nr:CHAT domain-containing protein [Oscillatoria sp. FACHB-1406]MBD2578391.1 CHAT domain-containing protein [Oscillatoria sp. FACHB-1406]